MGDILTFVVLLLLGFILVGIAVTFNEGALPPHQPQFENRVDTLVMVDTVKLEPTYITLDQDCPDFVINRSSWTCR